MSKRKPYHKNTNEVTESQLSDLRGKLSAGEVVRDPVVIYALRVISDGTIFYIGKTTDMAKRISQHNDKAKKGVVSKLYSFIRHLWDNGEDYEIVKLATVEKSCWEGFEIDAIRLAGEVGCNLRNTAPGGIAHDHTAESRHKLSVALAGRSFSEEHRRKLSEARLGKPTWNKGIHTGQISPTKNPDVSAKVSAKLKGRKFKPETIKRMSESAKGREPWNKGLCGRQGRVIQQIDLLNGEVVATHRNTTIALNSIGHLRASGSGTISECATGKRKSAYGFGWRYIDETL